MEDIKSCEELMHTANKLLVRIGKEPYIKDISECDNRYFVDLYEALLGEPLPGCTSNQDTVDGMIYSIQTVINSLSEDVLGMDISHVSARSIVNKDKDHIQCLLEIFDGLLEYVLEELEQDWKMVSNTISQDSCDSSDSDVLDDNHEILSDVIQEEFGHSYQNRDQRSSPNKAFDKRKMDDGVTWRNGNICHTVIWSDTGFDNAHSPSGDSTATDELINLAQTTGNSTDELITEAQIIQKELELQRLKKHTRGSVTKKSDSNVLYLPMDLRVLPVTSHGEPDIQRHQQKGQQSKLPCDDGKKWQGNANMSSSVDSTTASSNDLKFLDFTIDSLQTTEQSDDSLCMREPKKRGNRRKNKNDTKRKKLLSIEDQCDEKMTLRNEEETIKLSCENPDNDLENFLDTKSGEQMTEDLILGCTDTGIHACPQASNEICQTISTENNDSNITLSDKKDTLKSSYGTTQVQSNLQLSEKVTDLRSKQLSDLSERMQKLQKKVRPQVPVSLKDTILCQSNITAVPCVDKVTSQSSITDDIISSQSSIAVDTLPHQSSIRGDSVSCDSNVPIKEKKDKAKVSFQLDTQIDKYNYPLSDTEVDYSVSSQTDTHVEGGMSRGRLHKKTTLRQNKGKENVKILKAKSSQSDSSTSTNDTIISIPKNITSQFEKHYLKRDERLRQVHEGLKAEEKENKRSVQKLSENYSKHHGKLLNQKKIIQKQSNIQVKSQVEKKKEVEQFALLSPCNRPFAHLKRATDNKYAAKLSAIYGKTSPKRSKSKKGQKRSLSTSPVARRRYQTPMVLEEHEILPVMEDEFPFLHLSPHTAKLIWQKQLRHVNNLSKHSRPQKTSKIQKTIEDAYNKQKALAEMMKKEIGHNRRLKELKEKQDEETVVRRRLRERRQRSARARRYYNEYAIRNKAMMLKKRTKEEKIFKQLFEDGLDIQKQRINELRSYAKEQKEKNAKKQKDEIDSLENFYKDKFACLAESVAEEKYELEMREKAQSQLLHKMRSTMRKRMEKDLKDIQVQLNNDDDACFFRQLDADVLKKEFQLATYKASRLR